MLLNKHQLKKISGLITFSLMLVSSSVIATNAYANQLIQTGRDSKLSVVVDEAKLLRLDDAAAQIIVGNPGIADITIQNTKLLVLTGKSYGTTNLIILNKHGETILNTHISVDDDHSRSVTLHKGSYRASYHCSTDSICNAETDIGDAVPHVKGYAKKIELRKKLSAFIAQQTKTNSANNNRDEDR